MPVFICSSAEKAANGFAVMEEALKVVISQITSVQGLRLARVLADGLAIHEWLGLTTSFQNGGFICRRCLTQTNEGRAAYRVTATHAILVSDWRQARADGDIERERKIAQYARTSLGLFRPSTAWLIRGVDPPALCVYELMHTYFSGVFVHFLNLMLSDLVSAGAATAQEISSMIGNFPLSDHEKDRAVTNLPSSKIKQGRQFIQNPCWEFTSKEPPAVSKIETVTESGGTTLAWVMKRRLSPYDQGRDWPD
jgi:hypothetical protein